MLKSFTLILEIPYEAQLRLQSPNYSNIIEGEKIIDSVIICLNKINSSISK